MRGKLAVLFVRREPRVLRHRAVPLVEREQVNVEMVYRAVLDSVEVTIVGFFPGKALIVHSLAGGCFGQEREPMDVVPHEADVHVVVPRQDIAVTNSSHERAALQPVANARLA